VVCFSAQSKFSFLQNVKTSLGSKENSIQGERFSLGQSGLSKRLIKTPTFYADQKLFELQFHTRIHLYILHRGQFIPSYFTVNFAVSCATRNTTTSNSQKMNFFPCHIDLSIVTRVDLRSIFCGFKIYSTMNYYFGGEGVVVWGPYDHDYEDECLLGCNTV
jgi:hypothetical protein